MMFASETRILVGYGEVKPEGKDIMIPFFNPYYDKWRFLFSSI